ILRPSIKKLVLGGYFLFLFLVLLQHNFYASNQIAMFKRSLEHDPGNTRVRNSLAVIYGYAGKFAEAEFHYKEALSRDPYNTQALIGLGKSLADQGQYTAALEQYAQVRDPRAFAGRHKQNIIYAHEQLIRHFRETGEEARALELEETLRQIIAAKD
ncbi:MAG: tetratricopeptide repeat protein, partial [Candidatus Omnitrophica bacterium]|nr:tetratricopeptide repeat protein [Candidatus Omnitrophota bacterium]